MTEVGRDVAQSQAGCTGITTRIAKQLHYKSSSNEDCLTLNISGKLYVSGLFLFFILKCP